MPRKKPTTRTVKKKPLSESREARAKRLVAASRVACKSRKSWLDMLGASDKAYIDAIVITMRAEPDSHPSTVARLLKEELGLTVAVGNIALKLKELIRNG